MKRALSNPLFCTKFLVLLCVTLMLGTTVGEAKETRKVILAGGCFWCMEKPFEKMKGVSAVVSGFAGGKQANPEYKDVARGKTTHLEVVEIAYDPAVVSFVELLATFWQQVDPTDGGGQFVDRGPHYSTAVFYNSESEKKVIEASIKKLMSTKRFTKPIVTAIRKAVPFYAAGPEHQDFYKTNPDHYNFYRNGSGRDVYIEGKWGGTAEKRKKSRLDGLVKSPKRKKSVKKPG